MELNENTNRKEIDNIKFLLDYCYKVSLLYNEVANHLYQRFHIASAELSLLVTYYINEDRRKNEH